MANKISVLIDIATSQAQSSLNKLKSDISNADGAVNKFKTAGAGAFEAIKAHAGQLALVGGAALVSFGIKAATVFTETALSAGKFADATGLATEEASRWTAVADDIGISGESMEKAFGKLAVSVGKSNPLLEEFGITVQKGADGSRDMNATMLHAIDVIKGIQDPTKKAAVAQAALGKGWMEMAELIEQGSGSLTKSMSDVSEAQVIDPKEVEKARKMRESLDNLQDSISDVAMVLGEELVPELALAAEGIAKLITPIMTVHKWSKDVALSFGEWTGIIEEQKEAIDPLIFGYGQLASSLDEAHGAGHKQVEMQEGLKRATGESTDSTDDLSRANEILADRIQETTDRYRALKGELSAEEAFHNAEQMWAELGTSAEEAYIAAASGAEDAAQKAFDHKGKVIDAKQAVVALGEQYANLPEEEVTRIVALIDQGALAEAEAAFNNLARNRSMQVSIEANGGFTVSATGGGGVRYGAAGAIVTRPTLAVIGEAGPEAVVPLNQAPGASPLNGSGGGAPVFNLTVNAGPMSDGREIGDIIVGKLREYERRNGTAWRG